MDYIICAAGEGTRTKVIHPGVPKPLLKIEQKTLLEYSIDSLELTPGDRLIIVHHKDHDLEKSLGKPLNEYYPYADFKYLAVEKTTRGQLETAFLAKKFLRPNHSVVIFNSDTYFKSGELAKALSDQNLAGLIPCSREPGSAWSFCQLDAAGKYVVRVTEKDRISEWCSVGYYFFRDGEKFIKRAEAYIKNFSASSEIFVAPLYNEYIAAGEKIGIVNCEFFKPMGSLEQLQSYWGLDLPRMQSFNLPQVGTTS